MNDDDLGYDCPDQSGDYDRCMKCRRYFPVSKLQDGCFCPTCVTPAYYCFNDGRLADTFDSEADAASYVRDHGGYYASDLTEAEEGLVASDRAERRANL